MQSPMITANATQPASATAAPPIPPTGCPACAFPIRRIYAGELICPSCGKRETLARAFWEAVEAAMVGRGIRIVKGVEL